MIQLDEQFPGAMALQLHVLLQLAVPQETPQKKWPGNSGRAFLSDRNGSFFVFLMFFWVLETSQDPHQDADLGSSWCCMNSSQVSSFQCDMDCSLQAASNRKTPRDPADPG